MLTPTELDSGIKAGEKREAQATAKNLVFCDAVPAHVALGTVMINVECSIEHVASQYYSSCSTR